MKDSLNKLMAEAAPILVLGITAGLCIIIGIALGLAVDRWLGTAPAGAAIGILVGIAAAVTEGYQVLIKNIRRLDEKHQSGSNADNPPGKHS